MERWVDVRQKYTREVEKMDITIKKIDELNSYLTIKDIKEVTKPSSAYINGEKVKKIDRNYKMIEYTPLDKNYNVRLHVNDKNEILEYYFDITYGNEIKNGIPYYNDLYLDVIYYQEVATKDGKYIHLDDRNDLEDALKEGKISKEQYDLAYEVTDEIMKELKAGTNKFVNRGTKDFDK